MFGLLPSRFPPAALSRLRQNTSHCTLHAPKRAVVHNRGNNKSKTAQASEKKNGNQENSRRKLSRHVCIVAHHPTFSPESGCTATAPVSVPVFFLPLPTEVRSRSLLLALAVTYSSTAWPKKGKT